ATAGTARTGPTAVRMEGRRAPPFTPPRDCWPPAWITRRTLPPQEPLELLVPAAPEVRGVGRVAPDRAERLGSQVSLVGRSKPRHLTCGLAEPSAACDAR